MFRVETRGDSVVLTDGKRRLRLAFPGDSIVRVTFTENKPFKEDSSLIVVRDRTPYVVPYKFEDGEASFTVSTSAIKLVISKETGAISYLDSDGKLLMREPERGGKWLTAKEIFK